MSLKKKKKKTLEPNPIQPNPTQPKSQINK